MTEIKERFTDERFVLREPQVPILVLSLPSFETLGKLAVLCVSVSSSVGTMIVPTSEGVTSIK